MVKVDLLHLLAQVFEIQVEGAVHRICEPVDVAGYVEEVLLAFPDYMPPPNIWDLI
ncbi:MULTISPECIES: hypothetical protein [unclassified Mycolicibacterium]|uniref:hypothetical protein n=1 Tax=unclassified Mycolicibacterium TaxID=2636767 RepID=UPI0012DD9EB7|nr:MULTISPECIES: hypothetical protein [unclassified Mycolicibacterium]